MRAGQGKRRGQGLGLYDTSSSKVARHRPRPKVGEAGHVGFPGLTGGGGGVLPGRGRARLALRHPSLKLFPPPLSPSCPRPSSPPPPAACRQIAAIRAWMLAWLFPLVDEGGQALAVIDRMWQGGCAWLGLVKGFMAERCGAGGVRIKIAARVRENGLRKQGGAGALIWELTRARPFS